MTIHEEDNNFFDEKWMGYCIRRERKRQNISLEELAERALMSRSYISEIERGEHSMTIDYANRIAASLGKSPEELYLYEQSSYDTELPQAGACLESIIGILKQHDERDLRLIYKLLVHIHKFLK